MTLCQPIGCGCLETKRMPNSEATEREWYFVRRLQPFERAGQKERIEVQLLDDAGRALAVGYATESSADLVIDSHPIPRAVIEAAKARREGDGTYVGADGKSLPPF